MVTCTATLNNLAAAYAGYGTWIGIATGAPGTGTTPSNEVTGGSYARVQTTWSAGTTGVQNGTSVTINCPSGTFTYSILASASTVATTNMVDNVAISSVTLGSAGTVVATPVYTQT